MKKIEKRAIMCLLLAGALALGIGIFTYKYVTEGAAWATFHANRHVFSKEGNLKKGKLYDKNGVLMLSNTTGKMVFNDNYELRKANVHLTGDKRGSIVTGANKVFKDQMVGYSFLNGTYSLSNEGKSVKLSIDANVNATANAALNGRKGTVGVYNYKTGEIICAVSSPNYDPKDPPAEMPDGAYLSRFFSNKFVPGSTFKLVTAAASIENKSDYATWEYQCTGIQKYNETDRVTCQSAHGTVNLQKALAVSCNCYFGKLTGQLGPSVMKKYVKKTNLTASMDINGIKTKPSSFDFPDGGVNLAWAGIGQHNDLVNPCAMMTYMGAIANQGTAVQPVIVKDGDLASEVLDKIPGTANEIEMIESSTAAKLKRMMRNNVEENYGAGNYPGLKICAKSGTAEVGAKTDQPSAWFAGFLNDENNPYAFIVLVEKGGYGSSVAGSVANKVLQSIVK